MKLSRSDAARRASASWKILCRAATACGLFSLLALGCAGSLDPGVGVGVTPVDSGMPGGGGCEVDVLMGKCVSCHGTAAKSAGLDLQAANVGSRLVGKPTFTGLGAACPNKILLDSGSNPATGVFIDKITNDPPNCGGFAMPLGDTITMAQLTCLTTWATSLTAP